MAEHVEALEDGQESQDAQAWLSKSRDHWTKLDPLQRPLSMPDDPETTPENIRPFLNWSGTWGDQR